MRYAVLFVKLFAINAACVGAVAFGCVLLTQRAGMDAVAVAGIIAASIAAVGVIGEWMA